MKSGAAVLGDLEAQMGVDMIVFYYRRDGILKNK